MSTTAAPIFRLPESPTRGPTRLIVRQLRRRHYRRHRHPRHRRRRRFDRHRRSRRRPARVTAIARSRCQVTPRSSRKASSVHLALVGWSGMLTQTWRTIPRWCSALPTPRPERSSRILDAPPHAPLGSSTCTSREGLPQVLTCMVLTCH